MKYISFIIPFCFLLISCEKSPKCWGKTEKNEGEIIRTTTLTDNCKVLTNEYEGYVINSDRDLWYIYYKNFGNNGACELNEFNFDAFTI